MTSKTDDHDLAIVDDALVVPDEFAETLVDPAAYADGRVLEAYARLRATRPLAKAEPDGFAPFWVVTRHADILEISRQNDIFHNGDLPTTLTTAADDLRIREMTGGSPHLVRTLASMDAPEHSAFRRLTQAWFGPASLRGREERIRQVAQRAVEELAGRCDADGVGYCDFVTDVALRFPLHIIMDILGVPAGDEARMLQLTQEIFGPHDPDVARVIEGSSEGQELDALATVIDDFRAYFSRISDSRRAEPLDDLATLIANAHIKGEPISAIDQLNYYIIIASAGHDTTSSSIAGAVCQMCEHPALFDRAKADPAIIPGLIEEAIRWVTPVKHFMRSATRDVRVGNVDIAKGDWLMLCYASGNRDEEVFDEPTMFRPDRKPNRHLAFGYGAHLCLGQHLAKMEMRIFFEELLQRLEAIELNGTPKQTKAYFVNGLKSLPVRFRMSPRA